MATTKLRAADLRSKSPKELRLMLSEREQELMTLRFQKAVARLERPSRIRQLRREKARILTVMREKMK